MSKLHLVFGGRVKDPRTLDFDLDTIDGKIADFCARVYTFFRWVVTDDFLTEFGAER